MSSDYGVRLLPRLAEFAGMEQKGLGRSREHFVPLHHGEASEHEPVRIRWLC